MTGKNNEKLEKLGKKLKQLFMEQKGSIYLQNSDEHKEKINKTIKEIKRLKNE